jgi:Bacterial Ig-like domain/WD40-like Beta Propeller Repeat
VGAGRLRAVSRSGQVRELSGTPIDPAHDSLAISPGGRYAFLAPGGHGPGRLLDLRTGASHELAGSTDQVAFSADGATVVWVDSSTGRPRLASASSAGGPVLVVPLPVQAGDKVSDLAVSPDGSLLAYTRTRPDGSAELRLAALPTGDTVAVSAAGAGESPNWAPSGRLFTVLASGGRGGAGGARIEAVSVPADATDRRAVVEATVSAFANAQLPVDGGAERALAAPGVSLPALPRATRAAVLWVRQHPDGSATARVRLTADPRPDRPVTMMAEETLTLDPPIGTRPPAIRSVAATPFRPAPAGPQLGGVDTDAVPGAITMTFDSDLDPATVTAAVQLRTAAGGSVPATTRYDAAARAVTVRPAAGAGSDLLVAVTTALRDVAGHQLPAALEIPVGLSG